MLTDRRQAQEAARALVAVVAAAVRGGARAVLVREKDLPAPERRALAGEIAALLAPVGGVLLVAGDAALARELGGGVHLAAADPWPLLGPAPEGGGMDRRSGAGTQGGMVVGRSCHDVAELRAARREGAGYATLSPVYATPSKPGYGPALGVEGLAAACAAVPDLPVLALGGIGPGRAAECLAAGAHGVAVMGAVMRATDPGGVVGDLLAELGAAVSRGAGGARP